MLLIKILCLLMCYYACFGDTNCTKNETQQTFKGETNLTRESKYMNLHAIEPKRNNVAQDPLPTKQTMKDQTKKTGIEKEIVQKADHPADQKMKLTVGKPKKHVKGNGKALKQKIKGAVNIQKLLTEKPKDIKKDEAIKGIAQKNLDKMKDAVNGKAQEPLKDKPKDILKDEAIKVIAQKNLEGKMKDAVNGRVQEPLKEKPKDILKDEAIKGIAQKNLEGKMKDAVNGRAQEPLKEKPKENDATKGIAQETLNAEPSAKGPKEILKVEVVNVTGPEKQLENKKLAAILARGVSYTIEKILAEEQNEVLGSLEDKLLIETLVQEIGYTIKEILKEERKLRFKEPDKLVKPVKPDKGPGEQEFKEKMQTELLAKETGERTEKGLLQKANVSVDELPVPESPSEKCLVKELTEVVKQPLEQTVELEKHAKGLVQETTNDTRNEIDLTLIQKPDRQIEEQVVKQVAEIPLGQKPENTIEKVLVQEHDESAKKINKQPEDRLEQGFDDVKQTEINNNAQEISGQEFHNTIEEAFTQVDKHLIQNDKAAFPLQVMVQKNILTKTITQNQCLIMKYQIFNTGKKVIKDFQLFEPVNTTLFRVERGSNKIFLKKLDGLSNFTHILILKANVAGKFEIPPTDFYYGNGSQKGMAIGPKQLTVNKINCYQNCNTWELFIFLLVVALATLIPSFIVRKLHYRAIVKNNATRNVPRNKNAPERDNN